MFIIKHNWIVLNCNCLLLMLLFYLLCGRRRGIVFTFQCTKENHRLVLMNKNFLILYIYFVLIFLGLLYSLLVIYVFESNSFTIYYYQSNGCLVMRLKYSYCWVLYDRSDTWLWWNRTKEKKISACTVIYGVVFHFKFAAYEMTRLFFDILYLSLKYISIVWRHCTYMFIVVKL